MEFGEPFNDRIIIYWRVIREERSFKGRLELLEPLTQVSKFRVKEQRSKLSTDIEADFKYGTQGKRLMKEF